MTEPKINPLTGHEDGLPHPRPRPEILRELLASHQVDPSTHLFDVYYLLQRALLDLQPMVDRELEQHKRTQKRAERARKRQAPMPTIKIPRK